MKLMGGGYEIDKGGGYVFDGGGAMKLKAGHMKLMGGL